MKKLLLILTLFLPTLLFAQQDNSKQVFKIGAQSCKVTLVVDSANYGDSAVVTLSALLKGAQLKMFNCGDSTIITSFNIEIESNNGIQTMRILGEKIPNDALNLIKQEYTRASDTPRLIITIKKLTYKLKDKSIHKIEGGGMVIYIP